MAARIPLSAAATAADVVVIDGARLRASLATSLADLLRSEAGLQLSRNGGPGQSTALFVRGVGASGTLVLIDGVRVGSATLGSAEPSALGLAEIERIEVLRGPASSLYGADAVGGVVLITTLRGRGPAQWNAQAAVGGYGSSEASVAVSGAGGALDYALSASREASDGLTAVRAGDAFGNYNPDKDGYTRRTLQARLGWTPLHGHRLGLLLREGQHDARYDSAEYLPPDYSADASPDFKSRLTTRVLGADYQGRWSPQWALTAKLARGVDDSRSGGNVVDRIETVRQQAGLQVEWTPLAGQQLVLAWDRLLELARADFFAAPPQRSNTGWALAYAGEFALLAVQADLRRDSNSVYGSQTTGRLGLSAAVAAGWRLRALVGETFRAPSFNDLYYPGYGVAGIQPERGRSAEVGLAWQDGVHKVSATAWRNHVADMIAYESDANLCPNAVDYSNGCARNVGRARLSGLSLVGQTRWQAVGLHAGYDYLEAHDGVTGAWLPRRARHQLSGRADWQVGDWTLGTASLFTSQRRDSGGVPLRGRGTVDLSVAWRFQPGWQLQAKLLNAGGVDIEPLRDYQALGRQLWLGLRSSGQLL
ncbi:MAG: TonB-dependent receptor [Aquabacterium sp.]|nr:TonB-dependent receptor [Aquabacterium sp.]